MELVADENETDQTEASLPSIGASTQRSDPVDYRLAANSSMEELELVSIGSSAN